MLHYEINAQLELSGHDYLYVSAVAVHETQTNISIYAPEVPNARTKSMSDAITKLQSELKEHQTNAANQ